MVKELDEEADEVGVDTLVCVDFPLALAEPLLLADEVAVREDAALALNEEVTDEEADEVDEASGEPVPLAEPLLLADDVAVREDAALALNDKVAYEDADEVDEASGELVLRAEPLLLSDDVAVTDGSQLALADAEGVEVADAEALGVHPTPLNMPSTCTVAPSSARWRRGAAGGALHAPSANAIITNRARTAAPPPKNARPRARRGGAWAPPRAYRDR